MIAEQDVRQALLLALRDDRTLAGQINGIYDGAPLQAIVPYAVIGDMAGNDWGTKDRAGRELIITLSLYDRGENAGRLALLASAIHTAIGALPRQLGGWNIASMVPLRSRLVRGANIASNGPVGGQYSWQSEWRLRALKS
jgi:hypothetical protein